MSASAVRRTALPEFLTVGEVARRSGVAVSTVHFYEAKGLIAATRSGGNQRRFSRDVLRRVAIIRVAQGFGVSLAEIADLLKPIPPGKRPTAAQIRAMVDGWRTMLQARIEGLILLRDRLDGCIGCGCLSQKECPLRNPLDRLGSEGRGPVLLQRSGRS